MSRMQISNAYTNLPEIDYDKINDPKKRWEKEDRPRDVKSDKLSIDNQEITNKVNNQTFMAREVETKNSNFTDAFEEFIRGKMIPSSDVNYFINSDGELDVDKWTSIYDDFNPHQIDNYLEEFNKGLDPSEQVVLNQVKNNIHNIVGEIREDGNIMRINHLADYDILNRKDGLKNLFGGMSDQDSLLYDVWWDKFYGHQFDEDDYGLVSSNVGFGAFGDDHTDKMDKFSNKPVWQNKYLQNSLLTGIDDDTEDFKSTHSSFGGGVETIDIENGQVILKNSDGENLKAFTVNYDKGSGRPYIVMSGDGQSGLHASSTSPQSGINNRLYLDDSALNDYEVWDAGDLSAGDYAMVSHGDYYDYSQDRGSWFDSDDNREMSRDRRKWRKPESLGELIMFSYDPGGFKSGTSQYGSRYKYNDPDAYGWRNKK
tara:strand:+ start:52644 stop:53924 length:1281 start_codon:yes stop_codon:yes gene_type:complete